jgi:hypothetical protein
MWYLAVMAAIASLSGLYVSIDKKLLLSNENMETVNLAKDMAIYREAVITYFARNPSIYRSVSLNTLKSANVLPAGSTLYSRPYTSIWANYRDTDGMIYVYTSTLPTTNIYPEVMKLTQNSILVGVYRTGDTTLYSPAIGNTKHKLPSPTNVTIPEGSTVWVTIDR